MAAPRRTVRKGVELEVVFGGAKVAQRAGRELFLRSSTRPRVLTPSFADRNLAERVPGRLQTSNRGELLVSHMSGPRTPSNADIFLPVRQAIIRALETCPFPDLPIEIRTDSRYSIDCTSSLLFRTPLSLNHYLCRRIQPPHMAHAQIPHDRRGTDQEL